MLLEKVLQLCPHSTQQLTVFASLTRIWARRRDRNKTRMRSTGRQRKVSGRPDELRKCRTSVDDAMTSRHVEQVGIEPGSSIGIRLFCGHSAMLSHRTPVSLRCEAGSVLVKSARSDKDLLITCGQRLEVPTAGSPVCLRAMADAVVRIEADSLPPSHLFEVVLSILRKRIAHGWRERATEFAPAAKREKARSWPLLRREWFVREWWLASK
jgi:hypothetical protein